MTGPFRPKRPVGDRFECNRHDRQIPFALAVRYPHIERMEKSEPQHRSARLALWRGLTGRCPQCGEGRLFSRFLKVADHCDRCGTAFHHHRSEDLPGYLVLFIVGPVVLLSMLVVGSYSDMSIWIQEILWPGLAVVLALALIRPIKGAVIGLQWAFRMSGSGES